ncbi:mitochondrial import inner membrane translocase subunit Tim10 B [Diretmus argenteus]
MEPDQLRNLKDFLLVYNRMTEICFQRCTSNFNYRNLTMDEERCADSCAGKLIRSNHRLMGTYVQLMPKMVQRRMEEMESKAAENAKAAEAAEAALSRLMSDQFRYPLHMERQLINLYSHPGLRCHRGLSCHPGLSCHSTPTCNRASKPRSA